MRLSGIDGAKLRHLSRLKTHWGLRWILSSSPGSHTTWSGLYTVKALHPSLHCLVWHVEGCEGVGCRQRPLPAGPLGGETDVQSIGACPLLSGGGCFINEPIEWVQAGGWSLLTVGSTLGGQPGEWVWLGVRGLIPAGAPASNVLPGGPRWRHIWQMDSFSRAVPGGSGLWCWLMAGLPAHRHARFFICTASPELRQLLTDNEAMYTWMDGPGYQRHTNVQAHVHIHGYRAWLCWDRHSWQAHVVSSMELCSWNCYYGVCDGLQWKTGKGNLALSLEKLSN